MGEYSEAFVAFDTAKVKHAVAIADGGRGGEVRFVGEVASTPVTVERLIRKLAGRYKKLHFCYEAGPTGYGLYRQIRALGHDCTVVAPSLIPQKPGERVKNNRRDAVTLARLLRAGELTAVWVPDATHEAVRDLVRAREAAAQDLRRKRQQLLSFLLRHGRIFETRRHWTMAHRRWLADQKFEHPAQQIVFQDAIDAIADAAARLQRLEQQLLAIAPSWSMAPVVAAYQAMRGASFLVAVTFAAEIGDVRRFDNPRQLMGFLGLVPRERSTGERVRRSGLTLAGNRRARRVLVEAAWSYRHPARVSQILQDRLEGLPKAIRDIAWKAQLRLCGRYRRLSAAGKKLPVVIAAVARGWPPSCGRSDTKSRPPDHQHRHGRAAQHRGRSHGGESPSLVMWPGSTRRPPFRKRIAPRRRHGRR
jgi:transposase